VTKFCELVRQHLTPSPPLPVPHSWSPSLLLATRGDGDESGRQSCEDAEGKETDEVPRPDCPWQTLLRLRKADRWPGYTTAPKRTFRAVPAHYCLIGGRAGSCRPLLPHRRAGMQSPPTTALWEGGRAPPPPPRPSRPPGRWPPARSQPCRGWGRTRTCPGPRRRRSCPRPGWRAAFRRRSLAQQ